MANHAICISRCLGIEGTLNLQSWALAFLSEDVRDMTNLRAFGITK